MGATLPFENEADFSKIGDGLHISSVKHNAVIEVNEEGTEAAAATEDEFEYRSYVVEKKLTFVCNRPFMFIIQDNATKNVLFIGKYLQP